MNNYFNFLDVKEIVGDNINSNLSLSSDKEYHKEQLDIFKKIGTVAVATDFAKFHTRNIDKISWGTRTIVKDANGNKMRQLFTIDENGVANPYNYYKLDVIGARPTIKYSTIKNKCSNSYRREDGVLVVEYGEYPQTLAPEPCSSKLMELYGTHFLATTYKKYRMKDISNFSFYHHLDEHVLENKKYVFAHRSDYILNEFPKRWFKVEPIRWLVDKQSDLAISEEILFCVPKTRLRKNDIREFEQLGMYKHLNGIFADAIIPSDITKKTIEKVVISTVNDLPYGMNMYSLFKPIEFEKAFNDLLLNCNTADKELIVEFSIRDKKDTNNKQKQKIMTINKNKK